MLIGMIYVNILKRNPVKNDPDHNCSIEETRLRFAVSHSEH